MKKQQESTNTIKDAGKVRQTVEKLSAHLEEYTRQIDSFLKRMDNTFLLVGKSITDFNKESLKAGESSLSVIDLISGKETLSVTTGLVTALEGLSEYMGHFEELLHPNIKKKNSIEEKLEIMTGSLNELNAMKDHVSRLASGQNTAATPADQNNEEKPEIPDDIKKLSVTTCSYADKFVKAMQSADSQVKEHISSILKKKYNYSDQVHSIVQTIGDVINSLTEKRKHCTGTQDNIPTLTSGISKSTREIVISLQFQDITSQALNKIKKGLSDLRKGLKPGNSQISGKSSEELTSLLKKTSKVSSLLSETLGNARNNFIKALEITGRNLGTISDNMTSMAEIVTNVAKDAFESELHRLTEIDHFFEQIAKDTEGARNDQSLPESLTQNIRDITLCAADLEHIKKDVHRIFGNQPSDQEINRKRTPSEVLVSATYKLFNFTLALSKDSQTELSKVSSDLEGLFAELDSFGDTMLKTIYEDFTVIMRELQVINKDIQSGQHHISRITKTISTDFSYRLKDLKNLETMNVFVQQMISDLDQATSYCQSYLPEKDVMKISVDEKKVQLVQEKNKQSYNLANLTIEEIVDLYDNIDFF